MKPRQMKIGGEKVRGCEREMFEEVWLRYLESENPVPPDNPPSPTGTPVRSAPTKGLGENPSGTPKEEVPDRNLRKPVPVLNGTGVPDGGPPAPGWEGDA